MANVQARPMNEAQIAESWTDAIERESGFSWRTASSGTVTHAVVVALTEAGAFMPDKARSAIDAAERAMGDLTEAEFKRELVDRLTGPLTGKPEREDPRMPRLLRGTDGMAESILRRVLDPEAPDNYNALADVWVVDARVELDDEQVEYLRSLGLRDA